MAEVIARRTVTEQGMAGREFRSAGTSTVPGLPASEGAQQAVRRHGLTLRGHSSSPLSRELIDWADLILTMGPSHLMTVLELGGNGKSALLGAFALGLGDALEPAVPDPYGGDDETYEATFLTLETMVTQVLGRLAREDEE
jgi:protein-tyrosine-phosphatase